MTEPALRALDEDPDAALAVITGQRKGSPAYAAICLADAIRHGDYPAGWARLDSIPAGPEGHRAITGGRTP